MAYQAGSREIAACGGEEDVAHARVVPDNFVGPGRDGQVVSLDRRALRTSGRQHMGRHVRCGGGGRGTTTQVSTGGANRWWPAAQPGSSLDLLDAFPEGAVGRPDGMVTVGEGPGRHHGRPRADLAVHLGQELAEDRRVVASHVVEEAPPYPSVRARIFSLVCPRQALVERRINDGRRPTKGTSDRQDATISSKTLQQAHSGCFGDHRQDQRAGSPSRLHRGQPTGLPHRRHHRSGVSSSAFPAWPSSVRSRAA